MESLLLPANRENSPEGPFRLYPSTPIGDRGQGLLVPEEALARFSVEELRRVVRAGRDTGPGATALLLQRDIPFPLSLVRLEDPGGDVGVERTTDKIDVLLIDGACPAPVAVWEI